MKAASRGEFTATDAYTEEEDLTQINNLTVHLKKPEKEEQLKLKASRRRT